MYLGWVYLFAPAVTPSSFVLSAALIRPSALVVAALYVVSLSGIPSAVMSLLATAVAALTWPVPSTVTLYSPLALAVYLGWVYLFAPAVTPSSFVLSAALIRPFVLCVATALGFASMALLAAASALAAAASALLTAVWLAVSAAALSAAAAVALVLACPA